MNTRTRTPRVEQLLNCRRETTQNRTLLTEPILSCREHKHSKKYPNYEQILKYRGVNTQKRTLLIAQILIWPGGGRRGGGEGRSDARPGVGMRTACSWLNAHKNMQQQCTSQQVVPNTKSSTNIGKKPYTSLLQSNTLSPRQRSTTIGKILYGVYTDQYAVPKIRDLQPQAKALYI